MSDKTDVTSTIRENTLRKIESALTMSGLKLPKSAQDIESHIFNNARNKNEYLAKENVKGYSQNTGNGENNSNGNGNNMYHEIIECAESDAGIANVLAAEVEECVIDGFAVETFLSLRDLQIYVAKLEPPRPFCDGELSARNKRRLPVHNSSMSASSRRKRNDASRSVISESHPSVFCIPAVSKLESISLEDNVLVKEASSLNAIAAYTDNMLPSLSHPLVTASGISCAKGPMAATAAIVLQHDVAITAISSPSHQLSTTADPLEVPSTSCPSHVHLEIQENAQQDKCGDHPHAITTIGSCRDSICGMTEDDSAIHGREATNDATDAASPACVDLSRHVEPGAALTQIISQPRPSAMAESVDGIIQQKVNFNLEGNLSGDNDDDDDLPTDLSASHSHPVTVAETGNESSPHGGTHGTHNMLSSSENHDLLTLAPTLVIKEAACHSPASSSSAESHPANVCNPDRQSEPVLQATHQQLSTLLPTLSKLPAEAIKNVPPISHPAGNTEWLGRLLAIAARAAIENCNSNHNVIPERRMSPPNSLSVCRINPDVRLNESNLPRQQTNTVANASLPAGLRNIPSSTLPVTSQRLPPTETFVPIVKRESLMIQETNLDVTKPFDIAVATRQGSLSKPLVGASNIDTAIPGIPPSAGLSSLDSLLPNSVPLRFGEQLSQSFVHTPPSGIEPAVPNNGNRETATSLQQQQQQHTTSSTLSGVKRPYQQNFSLPVPLSDLRPGNKFPSDMLQAETKKRGIWCTAHVRIAWFIYQHQQQQNSVCDSSKLTQTTRSTSLANASCTTDSLNNAGKRIAQSREIIGNKRPPENLLDPSLPSAFLTLASPSTYQKQTSLISPSNFREPHPPVVAERRTGSLSLQAVLDRSSSGMIHPNDLIPPAMHRPRSPPLINSLNSTSNKNNGSNNSNLPNPALWTSPFNMPLGGLGSFTDRGGFTLSNATASLFNRPDPFANVSRHLMASANPGILQLQQIGLDSKRRQAEHLLSANENIAARAVQAFANSVESLISGSNASVGGGPSALTTNTSQSSHIPPPNLIDVMRLLAPNSSGTPEMSRAHNSFPSFITPPQQAVPSRPSAVLDQPHSVLDASFAPFFAAALAASNHPRPHGVTPFVANATPPSLTAAFTSPVPPPNEHQSSQVAAAVQLQLNTLFGGGFPVSHSVVTSQQQHSSAPWQNAGLPPVSSSNPFMFPQLPRR